MAARSLLFLCIISAAISVAYTQSRSQAAADYLRSAMDTTAQPCTDFYQYACGNWANSYVTDMETSLSEYDLIDRNMLKQLIAALRIKSADELPQFQMLRNVFDSCTKFSHLTVPQRLHEVLDTIKSWGVPISSMFRTGDINQRYTPFDDLTNSHEAARLMGEITRRVGTDILFSLRPAEVVPGLPQVFEVSFDSIIGYDVSMLQKPLEELLEMAYGRIRLAEKMDAVMRLQQFVLQLQNIYDKRAQEEKPLRIHLHDLPVFFPEFSWSDYFWSVFRGDQNRDMETLSNLTLQIKNPLYMRRMGNLLRQTANDDPDTLSSFFIVKMLMDFQVYSENSLGKSNMTSTTCSLLLRKVLPTLALRFWLDKVKPQDKEQVHLQAIKMGGDIRMAVKNILMETPWLTYPSRLRALQKADSTIIVMSYFAELLDDKLLADTLPPLSTMGPDHSLPEIVVNTISFYMRQALDRWGTVLPVSRDSRIMESFRIETGGTSLKEANAFNIFIASTQPPLFHEDDPAPFKFAGLGYIIGHQFGHMFQEVDRATGIIPDAEGNLKRLLDTESWLKYRENSQCVVEEYNQFCMPINNSNLCVNGEMSLNENLADIMGLQAAYQALRVYLQLHPDQMQPAVPGFTNMTAEQLFFLAFARRECGYIHASGLRNQFTSAINAPHKYEVNGPLRNFPAFATAFKCPLNTAMNPSRKCIVW